MKITVDFDQCEANALCEQFAPNVFRLDDDDNLDVLVSKTDEENADAVYKAVRACPRSAIKLTEV